MRQEMTQKTTATVQRKQCSSCQKSPISSKKNDFRLLHGEAKKGSRDT